ncbi:sensor histidine kinase, partial [Streptomyces griseus]
MTTGPAAATGTATPARTRPGTVRPATTTRRPAPRTTTGPTPATTPLTAPGVTPGPATGPAAPASSAAPHPGTGTDTGTGAAAGARGRGRQAGTQPSGPATRPARPPADTGPGPDPAYLDAVLRRFESALPAVLDTTDRWDTPTRQALNDRARHILTTTFPTPATHPDHPATPATPDTRKPGTRTATATATGTGTGTATGMGTGTGTGTGAGAGVRLAPHHQATVAILLMECAVLQMAQEDRFDENTVRTLAEAARHTNRPPTPTDPSACCWHEQRRISRELHDDVAGRVTTARLALEECDTLPHPAADRIATARHALHTADTRLRALVKNVREQTAVPPLGPSLRAFATDTAPPHTHVTIKVTGDEGLLPDTHRRDLYLTLREALRNAFTHSGAHHITVTIRSTRWWTHASVQDNGHGFDTTHTLQPGHPHQGIRSMTERMEDAGGRLTLTSTPHQGTRIEAHLPHHP